jgi:hypothetical protein
MHRAVARHNVNNKPTAGGIADLQRRSCQVRYFAAQRQHRADLSLSCVRQAALKATWYYFFNAALVMICHALPLLLARPGFDTSC